MKVKEKTKVITQKELRESKHPLPKSWVKAAGLLKDKKRALEMHVKTVRREWGRGATSR